MRTEGPRGAFTLPELLVIMALFSILSLTLVEALGMVTRVWRRTSARDDAVAQILKARTRLVQDLANSCQQGGQFATAKVGPNLGSGYDGDALTFLSSGDGSGSASWSVDTSATAVPAAEITYYLVVPNAINPYHLTCAAGPADSAGYEQQCPFKWLIRRVDSAPPAIPPNPSQIDPNWTTWLTRPTSLTQSPTRQVVADQLLGFRVLQTPPTWTIQLTAVAVSEATRSVALGSTPLSQSKYTLVEQFAVPANN